jgi:septum formation protein
MTTSTKWILASASPRRREILAGLGLQFQVQPSTVVEPERRAGEIPSRYAVRAARLKARETAKRCSSGLIIGADTIVVFEDQIMGKPLDADEAREMLRSLSGQWHSVVSGICLIDSVLGRERSGHATSRVHFRRLTGTDLAWYLKTGEYADKAGAYAIQGLASLFIDRIEGCYFNIVGFPIVTFDRLCRSMGIDLLQSVDYGLRNS